MSIRSPQKEFTLWCNEKNHKFPVDTFARVSKRCAALVKANDYQGAIKHRVSEDVFDAFSQACQLKPFKVTLTNAFELLELAQEWGIPSLEQFVNNYIESKGLKKQDDNDALGQLLKHLEDEDADLTDDISAVSKKFNDYLRDDRLKQVHPEHLFKIIMQAEPRQINQQLFIDFVMKLFEEEPEKAVPLCLRVDFDRITDSQNEEIFQCREMHEQAMGYFIAEALSAIRDKEQTDLSSTEQKYIKLLQDIREYIVKHRAIALSKVENEFESETKQLNDLIEKQQNIIEELRQLRDQQRQQIAENTQKYNVEYQKFERELERQQEVISQKQKIEQKRKENIQNEIETQCVPIEEMYEQKSSEIDSNDLHRRENVEKALNEFRDRYLDNYQDVKALHNGTTNTINSILDRINEMRACFASTVLNDELKDDAYMRDTSKKFEVFAMDPKLWDLTPESVQQAEEFLKKLEDRIRKSCPINKSKRNVNQSNQPSETE